ncbi:homoserine O-acetyltransferase MetA [Numidum massiliense]|uniref:homoserine O-acetyltransferase MetA n=1 Tax=Numidum massiliense TaxID=1522315 RepID=UPI0006D5733F|nr:homoserine O-succinyltransferase [Numidum massiliense]
MPIKVPENLPATKTLAAENIFIMDEQRAVSQDIRPLKIVILNLMPLKTVTETQLLRLLANTPLQVEVTFLHTATYTPKNTPSSHLNAFYKTFAEVRQHKFDGMVVTGAPVEHLPFEDVDYWPEFAEMMDWKDEHVTSTLHICWGAQAGLYHRFRIPKYPLEKKLFGVFAHTVATKNTKLLRGFDDVMYIPHSRYTEVRRADIERVDELEILVASEEAGVAIVRTKDRRQIYAFGHSEYDQMTLRDEYERDVEKGIPIQLPANYFPGNDVEKPPVVSWRAHAHLLFANWLNYYVYQETPYEL